MYRPELLAASAPELPKAPSKATLADTQGSQSNYRCPDATGIPAFICGYSVDWPAGGHVTDHRQPAGGGTPRQAADDPRLGGGRCSGMNSSARVTTLRLVEHLIIKSMLSISPTAPALVAWLHAVQDRRLVDDAIRACSVLNQQGLAEHWCCSDTVPGDTRDQTLQSKLGEAAIIMLCLSADFLARHQTWLNAALARRQQGSRVVPLLLSSVEIPAELVDVQSLPTDGIPLRTRRDRDEALKNVCSSLRQILEKVTTSSANRSCPILASPVSAGLTGTYRQFPQAEVIFRLEQCQSEILLMQTYMSNVVSIKTTFPAARRRGCQRIRILLCHPESVAWVERWKDYVGRTLESQNPKEGRFKNLIEDNLSELNLECRKDPDLYDILQVRLYHSLPIFAMHGTMEELFIGFYWQKETSLTAPQLLVERSDTGFLFDQFIKHYESVWHSSVPIELKNY